MNSWRLEQMNFQVNEDLDNEEIKKVRERYSDPCFNFVVEKMRNRFHISDADMFARPIHGPDKNLHDYQQRTSVTLNAPGNTGPPGSHQNYTGINDTPTYGQRTPKRQKKNGTFENTSFPGSHLNHTGHTPSHEAGTQVQDTPP